MLILNPEGAACIEIGRNHKIYPKFWGVFLDEGLEFAVPLGLNFSLFENLDRCQAGLRHSCEAWLPGWGRSFSMIDNQCIRVNGMSGMTNFRSLRA